jgi:hypothetical protein
MRVLLVVPGRPWRPARAAIASAATVSAGDGVAPTRQSMNPAPNKPIPAPATMTARQAAAMVFPVPPHPPDFR